MIKKVSSMLVVADLAQSKQFYVDVLGLKIQSEYPNRLYFDVDGHEIAMFQGDGPAIGSKHAYDANSTLIFTVNNLDEQIEHLKSHGVTFVHKTPITQVWGRYAAFSDPSGIVHEIFEPLTSH